METMTATELLLWQSFDAESPISDARGDVQAALIASTVAQSQGGTATLGDMLPKWAPEPEPVTTWEGFIGAMQAGGH